MEAASPRKRVEGRGFIIFITSAILLVAVVAVWAIVKSTTAAKSATEEPTRPSVEADFASAKYTQVEEGFASMLVEQYDLNHNNTGRQGVLVESQINHLQPDDGQPSGYHFFIYSPRIHESEDGSFTCDLGALLTDRHQHPFKVLTLDVSGEGFITDETIHRENDEFLGSYPGKGCSFVITGVHSFGAIPEDVWDRADNLWNQEEKKLLAQSNIQKSPNETDTTPTEDSSPDTSNEPNQEGVKEP